MTEPTYVPLTLESTALEMQVSLRRHRCTPEFVATPDTRRFPETLGSMLNSGDGWFCILRAFPRIGARHAIGRGRTHIEALIVAMNLRARQQYFDLRECDHRIARDGCDPEVVLGRCELCGRVEPDVLKYSAPPCVCGSHEVDTCADDGCGGPVCARCGASAMHRPRYRRAV